MQNHNNRIAKSPKLQNVLTHLSLITIVFVLNILLAQLLILFLPSEYAAIVNGITELSHVALFATIAAHYIFKRDLLKQRELEIIKQEHKPFFDKVKKNLDELIASGKV